MTVPVSTKITNLIDSINTQQEEPGLTIDGIHKAEKLLDRIRVVLESTLRPYLATAYVDGTLMDIHVTAVNESDAWEVVYAMFPEREVDSVGINYDTT